MGGYMDVDIELGELDDVDKLEQLYNEMVLNIYYKSKLFKI